MEKISNEEKDIKGRTLKKKKCKSQWRKKKEIKNYLMKKTNSIGW